MCVCVCTCKTWPCVTTARDNLSVTKRSDLRLPTARGCHRAPANKGLHRYEYAAVTDGSHVCSVPHIKFFKGFLMDLYLSWENPAEKSPNITTPKKKMNCEIEILTFSLPYLFFFSLFVCLSILMQLLTYNEKTASCHRKTRVFLFFFSSSSSFFARSSCGWARNKDGKKKKKKPK